MYASGVARVAHRADAGFADGVKRAPTPAYIGRVWRRRRATSASLNSDVVRIVFEAEGDQCIAVGGGPLRFALHPVDEAGEEGVEAARGTDDEKSSGLIGGVVKAVDHANGHVEKLAHGRSDGFFTASHFDLAFEDVEGFDEGLVVVERGSGEVAGDSELDQGVRAVRLTRGGFDVDGGSREGVAAGFVVRLGDGLDSLLARGWAWWTSSGLGDDHRLSRECLRGWMRDGSRSCEKK